MVQAGSPAWSAEIQAFLDHWRALRAAGCAMPTSEQFLDRPSARFMPGCYIVEVTADAGIVRFQGTRLVQMWQHDFTGSDMHIDMRAQDKTRSLSNIRNVVGTPCGHYGRCGFYVRGGVSVSEYIGLPLAVRAGRPPRIACFVGPEVERLEVGGKPVQSAAPIWVDTGSGVPAAPPFSCT